MSDSQKDAHVVNKPRVPKRALNVIFTRDAFVKLAEREQDQAYIFVNRGYVCRISRTFKHPGGDEIFRDLHGRDITESLQAAHRTDKHVQLRLMAGCLGRLQDPDCLLPAIDRDLRALRRELEEEGLFHVSNRKGYMRMLEPLYLLVPALLVLHMCELSWALHILASSVGILGYLRVLWFMHDAHHHSLFPNGKKKDKIMDRVSFGFLGFFSTQPFREHSVHHVFTNILEHDWNEEFLHIFEIAPEHHGRCPRWLQGTVGQWVFWYAIALPSFGALKFIGCIQEAHARGYLWRPLLMAARVTLVFYFQASWTLFFMPQIALALFAFLALLNHLHMPMVEKVSEAPMLGNENVGDQSSTSSTAQRRTFTGRNTWVPSGKESLHKNTDEIRRSVTYAMAAPSCNVAPGSSIYAYVSGGLNYHIEHHLFPCIASTDLPLVQTRVRSLLAKYGVPYSSTSLLGAIKQNFLQVYDPSRVMEPPLRTPRHAAQSPRFSSLSPRSSMQSLQFVS